MEIFDLIQSNEFYSHKYNENNKIYIKNLKNIFDFGKYFYKGTYGHNNFNHDIYNRMRLNINQEVISKEFKGYHLNDIVDIEYEADNEKLKEIALSSEKVKELTNGKTIVKTIVVPKKLVNIVVK